nr:hypothetical protein BdHM001_23340 [Bdellovibrio sp. HM001]
MGRKNEKIVWVYFPKNQKLPSIGGKIVDLFSQHFESISSEKNDHKISKDFKDASSDNVLKVVATDLESIGFRVEKSKKKEERVYVPVLFGINGKADKYFLVDAYDERSKWVVEVEAGRAVANYQFLKDLFQACVMVDVDYLCIAIRKSYKGNKDFETALGFIETLYSSSRIQLPLKGILLIGY